MSKVLRTAAVVVAIAAVAVATYGAAIGPMAAAGAGSFAGITSVATAATVLSASAAVLSIGAQLTAPKPRATFTGNPENWSADPQGRIPYLMGMMGLTGFVRLAREMSP